MLYDHGWYTIEGGAITTADAGLMNRLWKLKDFGIRDEEVVDGIGANAKMNEFCAVMGLCNLKYIDGEIEKRRIVFERYKNRLAGIAGLKLPGLQKDVRPNYAYFPVVVEEEKFGADRQAVIDRLKQDDIYVRKYFYPLTSDMDCYSGRFDSSLTPVAKHISERVITLPMSASLSGADVDRICDIIKSCGRDD